MKGILQVAEQSLLLGEQNYKSMGVADSVDCRMDKKDGIDMTLEG